MKMGKEHRVALSSAAVDLLCAIPRHEELIFPSRLGRPLSDMTLLAVLRRLRVDAVPHGMRATFRMWTAERTAVAREVVEAALAHQIKDKVEEAYQRSDLFQKRVELMEQWGAFCTFLLTHGAPLSGSAPCQSPPTAFAAGTTSARLSDIFRPENTASSG